MIPFAAALLALQGGQGAQELQPQDPLAAVLASQAARTAVIERVAAAVCSVMDLESPGGGSGVVIDPRGFVLTNYHVVGGSDDEKRKQPRPGTPPVPRPVKPPEPEKPVLPEPPEPPADVQGQERIEAWKAAWREEHLPKGKNHYRNKKVGLPDGQLYEAVVLGIDPGSDLAVLRLLPKREGQTWPWAPLGNSDALLAGETVFAMGNPFLLATDFTPTVTFGIVSGTHRYQEGAGARVLVYPDCIQTDAPVNPGNSGGPLFNENGEVVGINGRISLGDRGRVNVGVGFAIASNQCANFLGDLLAGRHAEHGTLDMSAWYMTAPKEETQRRGVFVQQMFGDSVVAKAGVSLGDEITRFDGVEVRTANQLATMVGVLPAGAWVTLSFKPAIAEGGYGAERTVTVKLSALDTGSSKDARADTERLGSRENRRIAARALLESFDRPYVNLRLRAQREDHYALTLIAPDGTVTRLRATDEKLRIDVGAVALVRLSADDGFRVEGGKAAPLTAEERARLDREWLANPFLVYGWNLAGRYGQTLLDGGAHVLGVAASRFEHGGTGECETWLTLDGKPAGYVMRDPLRRAKVEVHVRGDAVRVIVDGKLEPGWKVEVRAEEVLDEALFRRPQ